MSRYTRTAAAIEWPTMAVALAVHALFLIVTFFHEVLPWLVLLALGGCVAAWHSSLQHEVIHGHPTPWPRVNEIMASLPLLLWLPFRSYRESHLTHHRDEHLTDPFEDPESFYVPPEVWDRLPPWRRRLLEWRNSLLGRLTIGAWYGVFCFWADQARRIVGGDRDVIHAWLLHGLGLIVIGGWLFAVAGLPLWLYVLCFAWPGTALVMVRSFLEHQARPEIGHRTVVVEAGPLMSLLYLNNNLHAVHHARPSLPWYRLPAFYRAKRDAVLVRNGGYRFKGGYAEILKHYLFRPKESPVHPLQAPDHTVAREGPAATN